MLLELMLTPLHAATAVAVKTMEDKTLKNINKAAYLDTQKAGYYTFGSSSERNEVDRLQPLSLQLPSLHADCGGIDIFNGGFSFIKDQKIVDTLKSIGSGVKAYAFNLALETVSPQIASTIKWAQDIAQKVNLANIGSCEGAAALIGAVVPRKTKLHENTCKLMSANKGKVTDFVSSRTGCQEGEDNRLKLHQEMEKDFPNVINESCNVAWYVINKNHMWAGDDKQALKETLMSVTGTIITVPEGRTSTGTVIPATFEVVAPLGLEDDFFNAFAEGGATKMYTCNGETKKCLIVTPTTRTIPILETHFKQVEKLLASIEDKIYTDEELSNEEKNLVTESQIPILKIINIMSAYQRGKAPISIHAYAKIIAQDLLTRHIKEMLAAIRQLSNDLEGIQINADLLKQYRKQLDLLDQKIHRRTMETHKNVDNIFSIIRKTQFFEKMLRADMRDVAGG